MRITSLLFGLCTTATLTSCCKPPLTDNPTPAIVVVEQDAITENPDGSYRVTRAWFIKRMDYEQRLKAKLMECSK